MLYTIVTIYLVIINLVGIYVMWADKRKAKKGAWRIKEENFMRDIEQINSLKLTKTHVFHVLKDNSRTHNNLPIQPAYL